jgi:hypothetical protein
VFCSDGEHKGKEDECSKFISDVGVVIINEDGERVVVVFVN